MDCPSDCPYLQQARQHERPPDLTPEEAEALFPKVELPKRLPVQLEPLMVGLSHTIVELTRRDRGLLDRDVTAALTSLAKSYETLTGSGLIYQEQTANPLQQAISERLQKLIAEYHQVEQEQYGYGQLRDSQIFHAIVFLLRLSLLRSNGRPRSRAFLDYLFASMPPELQKDMETPIQSAGGTGPGSGLILP